MSNPKNQKYFVNSCLDDPQFKDRLVKYKQNTRSRCSVCHKVIELWSSGKLALTDHEKGQKHRNSLPKVQNFSKPRSSTSSGETAPLTPSVSAEKQSTIELHLEKSSATKAEIIWTIKSVMCGYSARLNEDMNETLAAIFPEFEATKLIQMSRSKSIYVVNHGLAPYFKSVLKTNLHKTDFLVYSFDESLNDIMQTTEMDFHVHYQDPIENRVKVRYYDSTFLGLRTHKDWLNHFKSITNDLPSNKVNSQSGVYEWTQC